MSGHADHGLDLSPTPPPDAVPPDDVPTDGGLVGRANEQRIITEVLEAAIAGRGGAVVVRGQPGIGKSALLRAASMHRGLVSLRVDCRPGQTRGDLSDLPTAAVPLALVIDDLHWADDDSLRALDDLVDDLPTKPFALVLSVRDHDVQAPVTELLERLSRQRVLTEVVVRPLDRAAGEALAAQLPVRPPPEDVGIDVELVEGNPLHLLDLWRSRLTDVADQSPADLRMRDDIADLLDASVGDDRSRRTIDLSPDARSVLSVAAMLGDAFSTRDLCVAVGRSMTVLLPVVHEALDKGVVGADGDSQLLFRDVDSRARLIRALPAAVRAELHRDIAAALDRSGASASTVAAHLVRACLQPADFEWAKALADVVVTADPDLAVMLWTRMRAVVPDSDRRSSLVEAEVARAFLARGDLRGAESTCRRALARPTSVGGAGSLRLTLATTLLRQARWAAARALGEVGSASSSLSLFDRAEQIAIAATAALAAGDADLAREAVERADTAAQRVGVARIRGHTLAVRGHLEHRAGRLRDAETLLRQAIAIRTDAGAAGDGSVGDGAVDDGMAHVWLALTLADMDRSDEANRTLDDADEICRGGAASRVEILRARAALRLDAGLIRDALDILDSLPVHQGPFGPSDAVVVARHALAGLYHDGRRGADRWVARLAIERPSTLSSYGSAWIARAVAARRALDGDVEGERQALAAGWAGCRDHGLAIDLVVLGPHVAATAAWATRPHEADAAAAAVAGIAARNRDVATIQAAAKLTAAFAASDPEALADAARMWHDSPRRLEAVRVAKRASEALTRLGHPQLAESVSAESSRAYMAQGARLNAEPEQPAIAPVAAARRRRQARRSSTGNHVLTRTERVVAEHVEHGESNAEIAARLVLSRRTVETHVSNILAKLNMRSRSDLIIAAAGRAESRRSDYTG